MTYLSTTFGGGSRLVSLWDMLRFRADKFVEVLNLLNRAETVLSGPETFFGNSETVAYVAFQVGELKKQLDDLQLKTSAKKADNLHFALTKAKRDRLDVLAQIVKRDCEELRERIQHELEGRAFYYISDHVHLLEDGSPLFGVEVDDAFPSARFDITEAGRCLALRRSTACVVHLMRALEVGLSSMASALGMTLTNENWNTALNDIEKEIRSRTRATHGDKWKNEDEAFFAEAATHFRLVKNAWRNHATHGKAKYTDEEAESIYQNVRSFMRHLSGRLSEPGQLI